jgi:hypothetical protein
MFTGNFASICRFKKKHRFIVLIAGLPRGGKEDAVGKYPGIKTKNLVEDQSNQGHPSPGEVEQVVE